MATIMKLHGRVCLPIQFGQAEMMGRRSHKAAIEFISAESSTDFPDIWKGIQIEIDMFFLGHQTEKVATVIISKRVKTWVLQPGS